MPTAIATTVELPLVPFLHGKARLIASLKDEFFVMTCVLLTACLGLIGVILSGVDSDVSQSGRVVGAGVVSLLALFLGYDLHFEYFTVNDKAAIRQWADKAAKADGIVGSIEAAWKSMTWELYEYHLLAADTVQILTDFNGQVAELILPASRVEYHFGATAAMRVTRIKNSLPDRYHIDRKDFFPKYDRGEHEEATFWITNVSLMVPSLDLVVPAPA